MRDEKKIAELRKKANNLPLQPGVYIMHGKNGEIIYIGKAVQLKNRVSQYFGAGNQHTEKVRQMVSNVDSFEYIICDSEFEALILESSLIKQHTPKYNILLKDDKGYHYIKITKGDYPKIEAVMQRDDDDADFLGPYNSAFVVRQTVDEVRKTFKLPSCSKTKFGVRRARPCLNFHIGICSAPCAGKISAADYRESVAEAIKYIKNGAQSSVGDLKAKMEEAAEKLQFEKAARLRDKIRAIEKITERQKVMFTTYERQDAVAAAFGENEACFEVFVFKNSRFCDRKEFFIENILEPDAAYSEFIRQYYSENEIPPRIITDRDFADREMVERFLREKTGRTVTVFVPQRGEQLKTAEMCRENAAEALAQKSGMKGRNADALGELAELLGLQNIPRRIEAYDISNTAGDENVGAMVTFRDGEPYKTGYRLFKIKGFSGQDDFRSMAEVIERRFKEYKKAESGTDGFGALPDLILLDGGLGQLSAVAAVLKKMNINVPVFGMVKDSKHKTRAIASGGGEIEIKPNRRVYSLVFSIQEEVHRFVINYHRKRRSKKSITSELFGIKGIGKLTGERLLKHFGSISALTAATEEDLKTLSFMNAARAKAVYNYYHKNDEN